MTDPDEDGPPDPQLDPTRSPGFDEEIESLEDIDVSRPDVTIGEATPAELAAADTEPLADAETRAVLADLLGGDVASRRRGALELGDREPTDQVVDALAAAASDDCDADVRQFAVESLATLDTDRAEAVAVDALADPDPWVRAEAVVTLDNLDRETYVDDIEGCLEDDHPMVRRNALISLSKHRESEVLDICCRFADDDSERVREWVAELLGCFDDGRARETLRSLADDESDIVAQSAVQALDSDRERHELFAGSNLPAHASPTDNPPEL